MKNKFPFSRPDRTALILSAFLIILCLSSLVYLIRPRSANMAYTADIYQNGKLIMSIPLDRTREPEIFTIEGENGCVNEIEVRDGSIGILSADCPDKLCVKQGFITDSRLPITCLPNRLVIQLRPAEDSGPDSMEPDAIAY